MSKRQKPTVLKPVKNEAETLFRRLEDGYQKIEDAEAAGRDTAFLDEFWLSLLREYEAVCDEMQKAA